MIGREIEPERVDTAPCRHGLAAHWLPSVRNTASFAAAALDQLERALTRHTETRQLHSESGRQVDAKWTRHAGSP